MGIHDKLQNAITNTWLVDALTDNERKTAKYIAEIAVSIQQKRRALKMTQTEFAELLGVSQAIVSRWENGEENFTAATLVKISSALGMTLCNPLSA